MKKHFLALTVSLLALAGSAFAAEKPAGADEYVGRVFEKLRAGWEQQARTAPLPDADLIFILNPDGTLALSQLEADSAKPVPENAVRPEALAFLKQAAPFEVFPETMRDGRLEFRFHFTPESMRMDSVRLLPRPVIADVPPVGASNTAIASAGPAAGVAFLALADRPGRSAGYVPGNVSQRPEQTTPPQVTGVLGYNAPTAGMSLSGYQASGLLPADMNAYVADVQARIRSRVQLPDEYLENLPAYFRPAVAQLLIDRDGGLMSALLTQSSGDKTLDDAILKAIRQSVPFAPVPTTAKSLPVQIETTFEPYALPAVAEEP